MHEMRLFPLIGVFVAYAAACATAGRGDSYELIFWPRAGAQGDPRVVEMGDHPCGTVAIARVAKMPLHAQDKALDSELALELSPEGTEIRRWSFPVDSTVVALDGTRLVVSVGGEQPGGRALSISPAGDLESTVQPQGMVKRVVPCPELPEFGDSRYVRCWEFEDHGSSLQRRVAYEGPCT